MTAAAPTCEGCLAVATRDPPPFNEAAATDLLDGWTPKNEVEFIVGNPMHAEVRKRWPRRIDKCLLCGAETIVYASPAHYILGDW